MFGIPPIIRLLHYLFSHLPGPVRECSRANKGNANAVVTRLVAMQLNMCTMCGRLCKRSRRVDVAVEKAAVVVKKVRWRDFFGYWQTGTVEK